MSENGMDRRRFLAVMGRARRRLVPGLRGLQGFRRPWAGCWRRRSILGATERGVVVESEAEYGGFLVEKLTNGRFPYEIDPDVLAPMREK